MHQHMHTHRAKPQISIIGSAHTTMLAQLMYGVMADQKRNIVLGYRTQTIALTIYAQLFATHTLTHSDAISCIGCTCMHTCIVSVINTSLSVQ